MYIYSFNFIKEVFLKEIKDRRGKERSRLLTGIHRDLHGSHEDSNEEHTPNQHFSRVLTKLEQVILKTKSAADNLPDILAELEQGTTVKGY